MKIPLPCCLDDLASRIEEAQEKRKRLEWEDFLNDRCPQDYFRPSERKPSPPKVDWPAVSVNAAMDDFDSLLLQQFRGCSETLASGGCAPLSIRCNYGTSILPSLFGVELFYIAEEQNTLPTSQPHLNNMDAILRNTVDKRIKLVGFDAETAISLGRPLHGSALRLA